MASFAGGIKPGDKEEGRTEDEDGEAVAV